MNITPKFFLVACAASGLGGCGIAGSGRVVVEERPGARVHRVDVAGGADVEVLRGKPSIAVRTDDNLVRYVTTRVEGDAIVIGEGSSGGEVHWLQPTHGILVSITIPDAPTALEISGSGSLTWHQWPISSEAPSSTTTDKVALAIAGSGSMDLSVGVSALRGDISGSGSIQLAGKTTSAVFDISGSGSIKAFECASETQALTISGSGSAQVSATTELDADISGSGSVVFRGSPIVKTRISGSGSVGPSRL